MVNTSTVGVPGEIVSRILFPHDRACPCSRCVPDSWLDTELGPFSEKEAMQKHQPDQTLTTPASSVSFNATGYSDT